MSTTTDRSFAEVRQAWELWILSQDAAEFADFQAAIEERALDSRVFFHGYCQGVRARLGFDPVGAAQRLEERRRGLQPLPVAELVRRIAEAPEYVQAMLGVAGCGLLQAFAEDYDD